MALTCSLCVTSLACRDRCDTAAFHSQACLHPDHTSPALHRLPRPLTGTSTAMGDVKAMIEGKIAGKKVMVFSKSYCPFCKKAKEVLKKYLGKELDAGDYEVMEIENDPKCDAIQDYLKTKTGARSVPRVFINGKCIGGGDETAALDQKGQLKAMLA